MKNKFGLIGLLSLLGIWGLHINEPLFLLFFTFTLFFEYLFITPDELFIENMRKAASWAFFSNLTITAVATVAFSMCGLTNNALAGGCALGFGISIAVFCFSTSFLEWREKWRSRHEN